MMGPWVVVATDEFEEWMMSLTEKQRDAIADSIADREIGKRRKP